MTAKWGSCVLLAVMLALSAGCRTPQPKLKPDNIATGEKLVDPPPDARFSTTGYPKEAFSPLEDPGKQAMDSNLPSGTGSRGPSSPGGMGVR